MSTTCKGCGKPIIWAKNPEGKAVPLDPKAIIYALVGDGKYCERAPRGYHVTHFATCSKASEFSGSAGDKSSSPADAPRHREERDPGDVPTMPFGKHRDKPLSEIPTDYLEWLNTKAEVREESLRDAIRKELQRRGGSSPEVEAQPSRGWDEEVPF